MDQFTKDEVAPELISISDRQRSTAICCSGTRVLSCQAAAVHPAALGVSSLTLPNGVQADFKNNIAGDLNTYHYESAEAYAIIVYNPSKGAMNGHARFANSKGFVLEYCGDAGHVWKEMNMKKMKKGIHDGVQRVKKGEGRTSGRQRAVDKSNYGPFKESLDNTTMVTYSVKFYYTEGYEQVTADIPGQIELYVAETNQGYVNSLVPLKVEAICIDNVWNIYP